MKTTILTSIIAVAMSVPALAGTILAYDTDNTAGEVVASEVAAGVTAFNLKRDWGLSYDAAGDGHSASGWTIGGDQFTAISSGDQFVWGFVSTQAFDLGTLDFSYATTPSGPSSFSILASINGSLFTELFADLSIASGTQTASIDLSAWTGVTSGFFLMPGWGASDADGTFGLITDTVGPDAGYGVALNAAMPAAVPLPAGLPLLAGALGLMGMVRRKRKNT